PRYIKVAPDDLMARTDYALALLRAGEAKQSEAALREALAKDENHFPSRMTLAFALREQGDIAGAREAAEQAKPLSPDKETVGRVESFIKELETGPQVPAGSAEASAGTASGDETVSIAMRVQK